MDATLCLGAKSERIRGKAALLRKPKPFIPSCATINTGTSNPLQPQKANANEPEIILPRSPPTAVAASSRRLSALASETKRTAHFNGSNHVTVYAPLLAFRVLRVSFKCAYTHCSSPNKPQLLFNGGFRDYEILCNAATQNIHQLVKYLSATSLLLTAHPPLLRPLTQWSKAQQVGKYRAESVQFSANE